MSALAPARERVRAGGERLSKPSAGRARWWRYLDADSLDIGSCTDCVLGKLYGTFDIGLEQLGLSDPVEIMALGFDAPIDFEELEAFADELDNLREAWAEEIAERLAAEAVPA